MNTIENLTPSKGTLTMDAGGIFTYALGNIKRNVPVTFTLRIKNKQHERTKYGCQRCTTGVSAQQGPDVEMSITYDAKAPGPFAKAVTEIFTDQTQQAIKFNGKVI